MVRNLHSYIYIRICFGKSALIDRLAYRSEPRILKVQRIYNIFHSIHTFLHYHNHWVWQTISISNRFYAKTSLLCGWYGPRPICFTKFSDYTFFILRVQVITWILWILYNIEKNIDALAATAKVKNGMA